MKKSPILIGLTANILLTFFFLGNFIQNISHPLGLAHYDVFTLNFIMKHYATVFSSGHWENLFTLPMAYGFKNSLFYSDLLFISGLMYYPLYLLTKDFITAYNLLCVFTLALSFLSMYLLCHHFTKSFLPSVIGAVIFTFNPFVFAHFPDHLALFSLQWIPLIFLYLEKFLEAHKGKDIFLFFLFLIFEILTSLYYSIFLSIILPLYFFIRLLQTKTNPIKLLNKGTIVSFLFFTLAVTAIFLPYKQTFSSQNLPERNPEEITLLSASFTDWFNASPNNLLYSNKEKLLKQITGSSFSLFSISEKSLFIGITPLLLFLLSFKLLKNGIHQNLWLVSVLIMLLSFLLSFGPRISPGPYLLLYKMYPLFIYIRAPARIAVFFFFFLSLIASLTVSKISKKILYGVILTLILLEFAIRPYNFSTFSQEEKNFYKELESLSHINVIIDLPIANSLSSATIGARGNLLDTHYLLYATALHSKKLINGYSGFLPNLYYERANLISEGPLNSTKLKLLKSWGVEGVVLHKKEFLVSRQYKSKKSEFKSLQVSILKETENLTLFDLTNW